MNATTRSFVAAALLVAGGLAAQAQTPPAPPAPPPGPRMMQPGDPAMDPQRMQRMQQRMQERMQRRMESLKRILQITPQQEGAWNNWVAAMRPNPQAMQQRHQMREELARMSTPERIDRLRQMRAQRNAEQDRRADATKSFYTQLTPSQQKAFDEISLKFLARRGGMRGHGHPHG